ncbi:TraR/DksA C4-type zinc finger protein [Verrucomicrobiales bacterium]|jgi:DnaK suppressor protein|nr:TraR/DksA C4-type zinc finger protein [Verrucomicrobiales bacterium]MDC0048347.1 TraR/DksA C4-type zinc finger protein [Verrucomicrobiota bacterium]NCG27702.1 conjugal transfer protein TraR [Verrucomicrobiales bacterium]|tara:strand:- start:760 stop:1092 length:333 start_codon:yes stop_codon:yes gene_type:complete
MDSQKKALLRERILERSVEIGMRIADLEESTKPISPDKGLGRLTRLEAMQDKSVNEAALERLRDEDVRLQNALTKILMADFGICQGCGNEINFDRLEALPGSTLCTECAG